MKEKESKKDELIRRLEDHIEFARATNNMSNWSFYEELIEYISTYPSSIEEHAEAMANVIDSTILNNLKNKI